MEDFWRQDAPHPRACPPTLSSNPPAGASHRWRGRGSSPSPWQVLLSSGPSTLSSSILLWQGCQSYSTGVGHLAGCLHRPPTSSSKAHGGVKSQIPRPRIPGWHKGGNPSSVHFLSQSEGPVSSFFGYAWRGSYSRWLIPLGASEWGSGLWLQRRAFQLRNPGYQQMKILWGSMKEFPAEGACGNAVLDVPHLAMNR